MAEAHHGQVDEKFARHLATVPANDDGAIWMVYLVTFPADRTATPSQWHLRLDALDAVGAEIVFEGDVAAQTDGDATKWDHAVVVKYPTRRSFIASCEAGDVHRGPLHGSARFDEALVIGCIPTPTLRVPAELEMPAWRDVPHPATDEDSPVVVVHVIRYADGDWAPEAMSTYAQALASVSIPHGAKTPRWFAAEGTVIGDGSVWDDVRFTAYPSCAAYLATVNDLDAMPDHHERRHQLIADQYTVVVRPTIDRVVRSLSD